MTPDPEPAPSIPADFLAAIVEHLRANAIIMGDISDHFTIPPMPANHMEEPKMRILETQEGSGAFIVLGAMYQAEAARAYLAENGPGKLEKVMAMTMLRAVAGLVSQMSTGLGQFPKILLGISCQWPDNCGPEYGVHWVRHESGKLLGLRVRVAVWICARGWRYTPPAEGEQIAFHIRENWSPE